MIGDAAPLYIVCSPGRGVGKTLLARLLTELDALDDRPVEAFDLADEGPQLADYLPQFTTVTGIGDITAQMAFFERLIAGNRATTVVDVGRRAFERFFAVVHEIGFFAEARSRAIKPVILFIAAPDPRSSRAYAVLRERFVDASLLPVHNQIEAPCDVTIAPAAGALPAALEIPPLAFALQAWIERPAFSFRDFWRAPRGELPATLDDALHDWIDAVAQQLRGIALALGYEGPATGIGNHRRVRRDTRILPSELPAALRKYAPKKLRDDDMTMFAGTIVDQLRQAGRTLRNAEERISALETEVEHYQHRAVRAEAWLTQLRREIEERLIAPTAANHTKIDKLGS